MARAKYPTDLKEREWSLIQELFIPSCKEGGRPPKYSKKDIIDAIFYSFLV